MYSGKFCYIGPVSDSNSSSYQKSDIESKIAGESFLTPPSKNAVLLEKNFVPLDRSIIWDLNNLFWKHFTLWEKTYGEYYEDTLPAGVSESHRPEFIKESVKRFLRMTKDLQIHNSIPKIIYIYEEGPGSGLFAKGFLDNLYLLDPSIYKQTIYLASDKSREILTACEKALTSHAGHFMLYTQTQFDTHHKKYLGKILFARHSNMWDQFPCRLFKKGTILSEVHVRAVAGAEFAQFVKFIQDHGLEKAILKHPNLWKKFFRSIKLQTKKAKLGLSGNNASYQFVIDFLQRQSQDQEVLLSELVADNLSFLSNLIDWERNGYMEIVDIISTKITPTARLLKFDGAISYKVNGQLIIDWVREHGKQISLSTIRQQNIMITIKNNSFKNSLLDNKFITIAEIAAKKENNKEVLVAKSDQVLGQTDYLTFSDMAHGLPDFLSLQQLVSMGIFEQIETTRLLCVFAARRKKINQIPSLLKQLKKLGVQNLIAVTGDPRPEGVKSHESGLTSLDLIPLLSQGFFAGAVCNAKQSEISKTKRKIKAGAKFLIVQSTFNDKEWRDWVKVVKKEKLHEEVSIIPSLIPLTTVRTIEAVSALPDIPMPVGLSEKLLKLTPDALLEQGLNLAEKMLKEYKQEGIFSGVYIYSKSPKIVERLTKTSEG